MKKGYYLLMIIIMTTLVIVTCFFMKKLIEEIFEIQHLYLPEMKFTETSVVPFILGGTIETVVKLGLRAEENKMVKNGLNNEYTINGETKTGYTFMYDKASPDSAKKERRNLLKIRHLKEKYFFNQKVAFTT